MSFFNAFSRTEFLRLLAVSSLLAHGLAVPASCQIGQSETMPPPAPDFQKPPPASETITQPGAPKTGQSLLNPQIKPPDLGARPPLIAIPSFADPNQSEAQSVAPSAHKRSLSWRSRAHKLRQSTTAQQKSLAATYDDAIMTLLSCLAQANLRVDTLNSKAGELLAVPLDRSSTQKYVFVFSEMPPGTVTIKASAWSTSKASSATIEAVLQSMDRVSIGRQP